MAGGGAGEGEAGREGGGGEGVGGVVPGGAVAEMGGEEDGGVPTAGHGEKVGEETMEAAGGVADGDGAEAEGALGAGNLAGGEEAGIEAAGELDVAGRKIGAAIDDGGDVDAEAGAVGGGAPAVIAGGEEDGGAAGGDGEAVEIGADGAGEHDARAVVAAENEGALDGAGGEDGAAGDDGPEALAGGVGRRRGEMVRNALERGVGALVVGAEDGGAGEDAGVGEGGELGGGGGGPGRAGAVVDGFGLGKKAAAEAPIALAEDDAGAGAGGGERGGEAGGASADDEDVAEEMGFFVNVGVGYRGSAAEAGGAADERLVDALPETRGPHEGFVVEAGGEERAEAAGGGKKIEAERWEAVLARRFEAGIEFLGGGLGVGLAAGAGAELDERARLLGAGRENPAGAMVFEGTAEEADAGREEGGGERVAGETTVRATVEAEFEGGDAVDQAARGKAMGDHGEKSAASRTVSIMCVAVSRVTTSQRRQPVTCCQNSRLAPLGFSRR